MYVQTSSASLLFDTGQGPALFANDWQMGIDLTWLDFLVHSHGHYDHTGNVAKLLKWNPDIQVHCHPDVLMPRYGVRQGKAFPIGIPDASKTALLSLPANQLHLSDQLHTLTQDVFVSGAIPRKNSFEDTGGNFFLDATLLHQDSIQDGMALYIVHGRSMSK